MQNYSKRIKDPNVRANTSDLLEENISKNHCDLGLEVSFYARHKNHGSNDWETRQREHQPKNKQPFCS